MKSGSNPSPRDDDDFTSAAESLLGIDLSSSGLSGAPIDLDDADLFGEPDVVQPEAVETSSPSVDETQDLRAAPPSGRLIEDEDDFGSDFGAGIVGDEPPPARAERRPAPRPQERPAPRAEERPAPRADERPARRTEERPAPRAAERPPVSEEPAPAAAPAARKDDAYWDALEGWDWSEETSGGKSAPKEDAPPARGRSGGERSRGRGGDRPSRRSSESRSERPAERPPAPSQERPRSRPQQSASEDDFGGGLEETPKRRGGEPSPDVSIFSLRPTESQSRFVDEPDEDVGPAPDVSTFGLDPSESQSRDLGNQEERFPRRGRGPAPRPAEFDEGDEFGAGLDEGSGARREYRPEPQSTESGRGESSEGEQRRGRRRGRGRGRGQGGQGQDRGRSEQTRPPVESRREEGRREESRRDEPEVRDDLSFDESFDEPPRREEPAVEAEPLESRFQEVPTWSEAIALLVKHRPRTSSSGSGDRGRSESSESGDRGDRGDGERSERGGSGGRGRGRGRGRRGGGGGRRGD